MLTMYFVRLYMLFIHMDISSCQLDSIAMLTLNSRVLPAAFNETGILMELY